MIFCPRNTRKARKYSYSCQDSINTKMTLTLECRLRLLWQAKLALRSVPASQELQELVPKLQLGNPVREALGNRSCVALPPAFMQVVALRTEREARASKTAFPSWSLGTSVTQ